MRMILLSAVLALGLGFAGAAGTSAESIGANVNNTVGTSTTIDMSAQRWRHHHRRSHMRCWIQRRCWHVRYSRRHCRPHRVCRHW